MENVMQPLAVLAEKPNGGCELSAESDALKHIEQLNAEAEARWADYLRIDRTLTRALVSFQANKSKAVYRWFKYKEAFSAGLVEHVLDRYGIRKGVLLDPYTGIPRMVRGYFYEKLF